MGRRPALRQYMSVSLPVELVDSVKKTINRDPDHAYTSVPDFIKEAVRRRVDELSEKLNRLQPEIDRVAVKRVGLSIAGGKFCHKCGSQLLSGAAFCSNCGTKAP
jgi:Arc/MetJ-type ribon-helix-helix transcriptional regulator